jgi:hypothetical protein
MIVSPASDVTNVVWNGGGSTSTNYQWDEAVGKGTPGWFSEAPFGPQYEAAFQVNVTPTTSSSSVPEPTTALFGLALAGVCATARRRWK